MTKNELDEMRVAFLKKKNEARKLAAQCDWTKDKQVVMNNKPAYPYLSLDKIMKNLLPIFVQVGLDFKFDYPSADHLDGVGSMSQHWTISMKATITDIDTGYAETTDILGEAADTGDKGLGKAESYAKKKFLLDMFMIIDGMDPDAIDAPTIGRPFIPKTDKEQDTVVSKVLSAAAEPKEATLKDDGDPTATSKPKEAPKAKEEPKKEAPKEELKAEEKKPGEAAIEKLKEEKIANYKPTGPKKNTIDMITAKMSELSQKGQLSKEEYETFSKDRASFGNDEEALAFIKKYKHVIL